MLSDRDLAYQVAIPDNTSRNVDLLNRYITGLVQAIFSPNIPESLRQFIALNSDAYSQKQREMLNTLDESCLERIVTLLREDYSEMSIETDLDP